MKQLRLIILLGSIFLIQSCAPHYVAQVPVAPVEVRPVPPYPGAVWVNGNWVWRGGRHAWAPGYYSRARRGQAYYPGEWRQSPRGNYYVRGRWR